MQASSSASSSSSSAYDPEQTKARFLESSFATNKSLSKLELEVVNAVSEEALRRYLKMRSFSLPISEKERLLCVAAYRGAHFDKENLIVYAQLLNLKEMVLLEIAAAAGNIEFLNQLIEERNPQEVKHMIAANDYAAFGKAAGKGHLAVIEKFVKLDPDKIQGMIVANSYGAFRAAARNGHLMVMEFIRLSLNNEIQNMIAATDYVAFREAAGNGHLAVIEELIRLAPDKIQDMIAAKDYDAFSEAAGNGHLAVIDKLVILAPDKIPDMIAANNYAAFSAAACDGHLAIIDKLVILAPDKIQDMIAESDYAAFITAAHGGHLAIIEKLVTLAPKKVQDMIALDDYTAFRLAAHGGYLAVIDKLVELAPDKTQDMVAADGYEAFRLAAQSGHLAVIEKLVTLAPDNIQDMVAANGYGAFRSAAYGDDLAVIKKLVTLAPDKIQDLIAADNYLIFREVMGKNNVEVNHYFLSFPSVLAYAEMHVREYFNIVDSFVTDKITQLRARREEFESANPNAVFNLVEEDNPALYFYIIRNLIRRNDSLLLDDIRFLLDVPAVKTLLHTEVTQGEPNVLLRLALSVENPEAATLLLAIPAIRNLAEQNNYYRHEQKGNLDLAQLARDRESSMTALTLGEKKRLEEAISHYQSFIDSAGISKIMQNLHEVLQARYQESPAHIKVNGERRDLPLNWSDFEALNLDPENEREALTAYYKNTDHTAFRYLSKPNKWMAENASYVYISDDRTERWSTFEEYQSLISLFFLAAQDAKIGEIEEGYTSEKRLNHFISELALIGRSHNWDGSREKKNEEDNVLLDKEGHPIMEEYDDLKGDKPSCFSGVKRRLFQSVINHPLLLILTKEIIRSELNQFIRNHFEENFSKESKKDKNAIPQIKAIWENFIVDLDEELTEPLKKYNLTPAEKEQFIQIMTEKYKSQFSSDISFVDQINSAFSLDDRGVKHISHFAKFYESIHLEHLLDKFLVKVSSNASMMTLGFLRTPAPSSSFAEQESNADNKAKPAQP